MNSLKWFCRKIRFREDIREKRDSAQYHTVQSREIEMSENPQLSHTSRSRTLRSVILRRVKQFYLIFQNFNF